MQRRHAWPHSGVIVAPFALGDAELTPGLSLGSADLLPSPVPEYADGTQELTPDSDE